MSFRISFKSFVTLLYADITAQTITTKVTGWPPHEKVNTSSMKQLERKGSLFIDIRMRSPFQYKD